LSVDSGKVFREIGTKLYVHLMYRHRKVKEQSQKLKGRPCTRHEGVQV